MYTSNFASFYIIEEILSKKGLSMMDRGVGIAGWCPARFRNNQPKGERFEGRHYKKLAPKKWIYDEYMKNRSKELYKERYYDEVLSKLDAKEVFEDLGENAILLCWEEPGEFCHRRIDADWIEQKLGIVVPEIEIIKFLKEEYLVDIPNICEKIDSIRRQLDLRYPQPETKVVKTNHVELEF